MRIDFDGLGSPKYNPDLKEVYLHLSVLPEAPAGTLWIDGVACELIHGPGAGGKE